jgi:hypothetical protein
MERDEVYVPNTRSDLGIPPPGADFDYEDIFGDTPLFTLFMLLRQQLLAFPAYLGDHIFHLLSACLMCQNFQSSILPDKNSTRDGPTIFLVRSHIPAK